MQKVLAFYGGLNFFIIIIILYLQPTRPNKGFYNTIYIERKKKDSKAANRTFSGRRNTEEKSTLNKGSITG
jgi:hypothetical protein